MKMNHFFKLNNMLRSIAESTYKKVSLGYGTYELNGMCSDYVSHRSIEIFPQSHGSEGIILFENRKYSFAISASADIVERKNVIVIDVLKKQLEGFIKTFEHLDGGGDTSGFSNVGIVMPAWYNLRNYFHIVMPDYFSGYDEEGKALFAHGNAEFSITAKDTYGSEYDKIFLLETRTNPEQEVDEKEEKEDEVSI